MKRQILIWRTPTEGLPEVAKNGLSEPVLYQYIDADIYHANITEIGQYSDAPWCQRTFITDMEEGRQVGVDAIICWAYLNEEHENEYSLTHPKTT
ncbi:MAG TPA: hypothetical protein VL943_04300 [Niabella sp.]|nr:hypothetical protein [Niabella sp.]